MAIEVTVDATIDYAILNFRRLINWSEKKEVESLNLANLNYRLAKLPVACCLLKIIMHLDYLVN